METKRWVCDTCNAEVDKPRGYPPDGWAAAIANDASHKRIHICPGCHPKVLRQLTDQFELVT